MGMMEKRGCLQGNIEMQSWQDLGADRCGGGEEKEGSRMALQVLT